MKTARLQIRRESYVYQTHDLTLKNLCPLHVWLVHSFPHISNVWRDYALFVLSTDNMGNPLADRVNNDDMDSDRIIFEGVIKIE